VGLDRPGCGGVDRGGRDCVHAAAPEGEEKMKEILTNILEIQTTQLNILEQLATKTGAAPESVFAQIQQTWRGIEQTSALINSLNA
jgi:hypothetical protein